MKSSDQLEELDSYVVMQAREIAKKYRVSQKPECVRAICELVAFAISVEEAKTGPFKRPDIDFD